LNPIGCSPNAAVYYRIDGETCIVFRVLDCRQSPEKTVEGLR
jgi:hypothetical protein